MPDSCFVPKDIMDYRYHDKRRLYLSVIASELSKEPTFSDVLVRGWREGNDDSKPILVFKLQSKTQNISSRAKKFSIRVYPVISKNVFELVKLNPLKGNLRMHRENPLIAGETVEEAKVELTRKATPRYNCSILEDMDMRDHLQNLHQMATTCKGFIGACQLLKVWLHRRQMLNMPDTFNGFLISMLTYDLLQKNEININASRSRYSKKL